MRLLLPALALMLFAIQPSPAMQFDVETGLMHAGAREYDPALGRFLQEDPVSFATTDLFTYAYSMGRPASELLQLKAVIEQMHGTSSLYHYAFNSPLSFTDPQGTSPLPLGWILPYLGSPANAPAVGEQTYSPSVSDEQLEFMMEMGLLYYGTPLINQNRYLRMGPGRNGGRRVFRVAGQCLEKATGQKHFDILDLGPWTGR